MDEKSLKERFAEELEAAGFVIDWKIGRAHV